MYNPIRQLRRGNRLHHQGDVPAAASAYARHLRTHPEDSVAHYNLGLTLETTGRIDEAVRHYSKAIQQNPYYPEALLNLGRLLHKGGKIETARLLYARALAARPNYEEAEYNYATAEADLRDYRTALLYFSRVLERNPKHAEAWNNLGNTFLALKQPEDAWKAFEAARAIRPEIPDIRWNSSLALLTLGRMKEAWTDFEHRRPLRHVHLPRWDGRPLVRKHLLIHAEQGLGDTIQFFRYCGHVQAGHITFTCHPQLIHLFRSAQCIGTLVPFGAPLPQVDYEIPLMSLPGLFQTDLESVPARVPYLFADPGLVETWRTRMRAPVHSLKVGIVWAGNPNHRNDRNRSLDPALLKPLATVEKTAFYCLQQKPHSAAVPDLSPLQFAGVFDELTFPDTAAIIQNLDLVISVDTAVAHLAGALARPVWTLLPYAPDWRWMLDRADTPWYPTMRLFRQPRLNDWPSVIDEVVTGVRMFSPSPDRLRTARSPEDSR